MDLSSSLYIENNYGANLAAERKGNAETTIQTKYSDINKTTAIEKTTTRTSLFDTIGNARELQRVTQKLNSLGVLENAVVLPVREPHLFQERA